MRGPLLALLSPVCLLAMSGCGGSAPASQPSTPTEPASVPAASTETPAPAPADNSGGPAPVEFNANKLLMGTAKPSFPAGEPGKVSVVAQGKLSKGILPFAFRNNTNEAISHVDWTAAASAGGSIVTTGTSQGTDPAQLQPGEVGLAYIYFSSDAKMPPANATYEFSAETTPADKSSYNTASLQVTQANLSGGSIVGSAVNNAGAIVAGPYSATAYCFKGNDLLSTVKSYADQSKNVSPNGKVTFKIDLLGRSCPAFVVGVSGYFDDPDQG